MGNQFKLALLKPCWRKPGEEGFSLMELTVVVAVLSTLSALALPVYDCFQRRAKSVAAQQAIIGIKSECQRNYASGIPAIFTYSALKNYEIRSSGGNSCADGVISAVPDDIALYPTYFYTFDSGELSYEFRGKKGTSFVECDQMICNKITQDEKVAVAKIKEVAKAKGEEVVVAKSSNSSDIEQVISMQGFSPVKVKKASCNTYKSFWRDLVPGELLQHGNPSMVLDGNPETRWICDYNGHITVDLGSKQLIDSINIFNPGFTSSVLNNTSSGNRYQANYVRIFVDGNVVAEGFQKAGVKEQWDINDVQGREITYETIRKPHNESCLILNGSCPGGAEAHTNYWTEVGQISINGAKNDNKEQSDYKMIYKPGCPLGFQQLQGYVNSQN